MTATPDAPIPATVLGGYLGAGKTTLVNRLLRDPGGRRIGVLVNDIGEVSIDAALIAEATDDLVTLANGCICCTLSDGFAAALDPLRGLPLDAIVVECSGVADPNAVAAHVQTPGFALAGVVVLADASTLAARAVDRYVGTTVTRQLAAADLVVLNKADLVDDGAARTAAAVVGRAAPGTPVLTTVDADVATEVVLGARHHDRALDVAPLPGHPTTTTTWTEPLTRAALDALLGDLPPHTVRAKGVFDVVEHAGHRVVVQVVGRRATVTVATPWPAGTERRSVLVTIEAPPPDA